MLNQDYKEMLSILLENDVKFLLVGAYAMAVYGFLRATADIDIFVSSDSENVKKLYKSLEKFGAPTKNISPNDFEKPGTIFQIGVAPRRIDIINEIDGVTFDEAYEDKIVVELDRLMISVISKEKLIRNKLATGRPQDKLDAKKMNKS